MELTRNIQIFLIAIITISVYVNIMPNEFIYDDETFIIDNPDIRDIDKAPELVKGKLPYGHKGVFRPVRSLIYMISYKLWKLNPIGYHIQSIFIHTANTILVYLIIFSLTRKEIMAFTGSMIFGVHSPSLIQVVISFTLSPAYLHPIPQSLSLRVPS